MAMTYELQRKGEVSTGSSGTMELFANYPDLLTPKHISEITGMTVQYVRTLCREGKLPAVLIGKARWYIPKTRFIELVMAESAND